MPLDEYRAANLANWNERVAGHLAPDGYSVDRLVDEPGYLTDVVRFDSAVLGNVAGKTLLHSQCHIGTDTLSWAKLGARVTGLDFSPPAIAAARSIADRLGVDASFVETEFYDAPNHIHRQFDIVYTSVGAINWLPDIESWGRILADFVRPGGTFYIRDAHPMLHTLDDERADRELIVTHPYFDTGEPMHWVDAESYLGSAVLENADLYEWHHPIADVVNALIGGGLIVERMEELRHLDWAFFPFMEEVDGVFVMPEELRQRVPLQFSVRARKPT